MAENRECEQCDGTGGYFVMSGDSDYPNVDYELCVRCAGRGQVGIMSAIRQTIGVWIYKLRHLSKADEEPF